MSSGDNLGSKRLLKNLSDKEELNGTSELYRFKKKVRKVELIETGSVTIPCGVFTNAIFAKFSLDLRLKAREQLGRETSK